MELNDNKAGMQGLEKDKINAIIQEASKNSRFSKHQQKRDNRIKEKVEQQKKVLESFTSEKLRLAEMQMDRLVEELESQRDLSRVVAHLDMDAFYAAVEMRDDPDLRNKPIAVGGTSMLSTSNYAARKFGVRAAQPGFIGKKLCPELIIVPCNFDKYSRCSEKIREKMKEYDPNFITMSMDEAYLDLTDYLEERKKFSNCPKEHKRIRYSGDCQCRLPYDESLTDKESTAFDEILEEACTKCGMSRKVYIDRVEFTNDSQGVVKELRFKIEQATGLTASAGIAVNAMLAKVCSDKNKPNGQFYLPADQEMIMNFVKNLPIRKVCGIGGVTEAMLKGLGINVCSDLYEKRAILNLFYSKISTKFFLKVSLGLGSSMFEHRDSDRKSISVERTFSEVNNPDQLYDLCRKLCEKLADDVQEEEVKGRTVTLKLKTVDFRVRTRAQSSDRYISDAHALYEIAKNVLQCEIDAAAPDRLRLRLMGVRLSHLVSKNEAESKHSKAITEFFKPLPTNGDLSNDTCTSNNDTCETVIRKRDEEESMDCIILSDDDDYSSKCESIDSVTCESSNNVTCESSNNVTCESSNNVTCESSNNVTCGSVNEFFCPVCNIKQPTIKDLAAFNMHVDQCLSVKTIVEIENKQKAEEISKISSNSKRKISSISSEKRQKRTIDDYFQKKI